MVNSCSFCVQAFLRYCAFKLVSAVCVHTQFSTGTSQMTNRSQLPVGNFLSYPSMVRSARKSDIPGRNYGKWLHSARHGECALRNSHPEFFSTGSKQCHTQIPGLSTNATRGALDPAKNETFVFVDAFLRDYYRDDGTGVFVDDFVHLGSDEVPTNCWDNPADNDFIAAMGIRGGSAGLFSYFVRRVHAIAAGLGRRVVMWDAAFNKGSDPPPQDIVIQMWNSWSPSGDHGLLQQIVSAGYDAIASPDIPW